MSDRKLGGVVENTIYRSAISRLDALINEAGSRGVVADVAALATCGTDARPSARMVNILEVGEAGLVFFINQRSGKGSQLAENPRATLCFYWPKLQEQVVVEGSVEQQPEGVSDRLWNRRVRDSKLAAWAAPQGEHVSEKGTVRQRVQQYRKDSGFDRLPRHSDWHAYSLVPDRIEFWPSGWHRARERVRYLACKNGEWMRELVNP